MLAFASPAIDPTVEEEYLKFDFGPGLGVGVSITGATITCRVVAGSDPAPASRVLSSPAFITSPSTGAPSAAVLVLVGKMLAAVVYQFQCLAACSDTQVLSVRLQLPCAQPPGQ